VTADEYRAALESLDLSINAAGRWLGVSEKTGKNYAKDGPSPPAARAVQMLLGMKPADRKKALLRGEPLTSQQGDTP
jgi:hypothetical protein